MSSYLLYTFDLNGVNRFLECRLIFYTFWRFKNFTHSGDNYEKVAFTI